LQDSRESCNGLLSDVRFLLLAWARKAMLGYHHVIHFSSGDYCSMRTSSQAVPPRPAASAAAGSTSSAYLWWAMTSIVLGGYISVLTNHVMNMVLPKMMSDLGTDVITIRWV